MLLCRGRSGQSNTPRSGFYPIASSGAQVSTSVHPSGESGLITTVTCSEANSVHSHSSRTGHGPSNGTLMDASEAARSRGEAFAEARFSGRTTVPPPVTTHSAQTAPTVTQTTPSASSLSNTGHVSSDHQTHSGQSL
ncbi:unnamed protein product, partial [Protopolystoma xenopodis]